jgi:Polyketide cyclase / dehydrase and lipid transport
MHSSCRSVDAAFFDTARWRFRSDAELPVTAKAAFALFEDASAWPKWISAITRVTWTSPRPFGAGTTRTVELRGATVFEHFFRWEQDRRFSFFVLSHDAPLPLFRALAEDYLLEDLPGGRCRFTYVVALDPAFALRVLGPIGRFALGRGFGGAPKALARVAKSLAGTT